MYSYDVLFGEDIMNVENGHTKNRKKKNNYYNGVKFYM